MIRRLLRRLAEWVTADPSPDLCPRCAGYPPACEVYGHIDDQDQTPVPCDPNAMYDDEPWDADEQHARLDESIKRGVDDVAAGRVKRMDWLTKEES